MKKNLHLITFGVKDLKKSTQFYKQLFGWEIAKDSQETITFFKTSTVVIGLYPYDLLAEDAQISPEGNGFRGVTFAHNVEKKKDVEVFLKKAEQCGAKIVKDAQEVFWGGYHGYFSDLDGNLWEVAWNPGFPFDDEGRLELS